MGLVRWDRAGGFSGGSSIPQLLQAQNNQFNLHVHVEYEWWLDQDDMNESDDELDEKVRTLHGLRSMLATIGPSPTTLKWVLLCCLIIHIG